MFITEFFTLVIVTPSQTPLIYDFISYLLLNELLNVTTAVKNIIPFFCCKLLLTVFRVPGETTIVTSYETTADSLI